MKKNRKTNAQIKKAFDELMQKNSKDGRENKSIFSPLRRVTEEHRILENKQKIENL